MFILNSFLFIRKASGQNLNSDPTNTTLYSEWILCQDGVTDGSDLLECPGGQDFEGIDYPRWAGTRFSLSHLFVLIPHNAPSSFKSLLSPPSCVFCCTWKSNMGVEKKVLGQMMQRGWKSLVQIWHKK